MKFKCRMNVPVQTEWFEVEADSWADAANSLHTFRLDGHGLKLFAGPDENPHKDGFLDVTFAVMEVEGHGEAVSRFYRSGIYRKGGLKPLLTFEQRLKVIADKLGWTKDPSLLIAPGWEDEDTEWVPSHSASIDYKKVSDA